MTLFPLPELAERLRSDWPGLYDYLAAVEAQFARREPVVHAFVPEPERFVRLRREAAALTRRFPDAARRPPLFGVLVGVKDIFHVDGMVTRAGSRLPAELLQGNEAAVVTQLRSQGALILGKTVTTEFAYFAPGPTTNPHNPAHTPGGSSSGSAAAIAANLCALTLGTQTIGSINRPAAFCGVAGLKPTFGRVSTAGVIPLSPSFDHVGFFAHRVGGAALAASLTCRDWRRVPLRNDRPVLAIPEGPYLDQAEPAGRDHFEATVQRLSAAGYPVKRLAAMPDYEEITQHHLALMAADTARVHAAWFPVNRDLYHARTARLIMEGQAVSITAVSAARDAQTRLRERLTTLMDQNDVDFWISPAAPGEAPAGLASTGNPGMNLPWTNAGMPAVTIPTGIGPHKLPLGLQVAARSGQDERLLADAVGIEACAGWFGGGGQG